jgi:secreted PhoX family phosphatase
MSELNRRELVRAAVASGCLLGVEGLIARAAFAGARRDQSQAELGNGGYGPLTPRAARNTGETLLALPPGFEYNVLGKAGRTLSDGQVTPSMHDGMAAFPDGKYLRLVRNHELKAAPGAALAGPERSYDPTAGAGTTTLIVDPKTREIVRDFVSLSGTLVNCAGGPTPWGTWISCEETVLGRARVKDKDGKEVGGYAEDHGYCFEVRARAGEPTRPVPLKAMGRFVHEAVAVDPATGIVYETEDRALSGFYRFLPARPGKLAEGGKLQMLRVKGRPEYDTRSGQTMGQPLPVDWVDIPDPDPASASANDRAVYDQGRQRGGATFARLEGCWYGNGYIYLNATSGGDKQLGQVWQYRPKGANEGELTLLFESKDPALLNAPDNLCVSPRGGLVLCEDSPGATYVRGLTPQGRIFDLAKNVLDTSEAASATFSPDGKTLFFNIQSKVSFTVAVWGPWERGAL